MQFHNAIPSHFAVYLGNVSDPRGIPRQHTARDGSLLKPVNKPVLHDEQMVSEGVQSTGSQQMEPLRITLDKHITAKLPYNARIITAFDCRNSNPISRAIRIHTRAPTTHPARTGFYRTYLLKLLPNREGHDILRGEHNSSKAIHDIAPYFIPKPIAWGTLAQDENIHFLISDFHEMDSQVLNIERFGAALAELHRKSAAAIRGCGAGSSGWFGFHVSTFNGDIAQKNSWTKTWEEYFSGNFRQMLDLEEEVHGAHNPEFMLLSNAVLVEVIPRLLRPLETGSRRITPTLLHGNIESGKVSTSLRFSIPMTYGACSFYGHNEYDLRNFVNGGLGAEYMRAYHKFMPVSEPREDFWDRMALYGLTSLLQESCSHPGDKRFRGRLVEGMKVLVDKFADGHQGDVVIESDVSEIS